MTNEGNGNEVINLRLERRLRRLHKPDGNCFYCERAADRYHPVGPIVVKITEPDEKWGVPDLRILQLGMLWPLGGCTSRL
jgi:hypothetical protein